jgi:hypothetical protein
MGDAMNETPDPILELALRNAREHRDDMARWLALEVLLNDPLACEDEELQEHLILLQDKIEAKLRASSLPVRPAVGEGRVTSACVER